MTATKEQFFKEQARSASGKADERSQSAYATIMTAEMRQRDAKTARLRELRLEREASSAPQESKPVVAKPKRKPAARRSRFQ